MTKIIGIVLASLLLFVTLNSSYYFLAIADVTFIQWIVFNACAPSNIVFMVGLAGYGLTKKHWWLVVATVPVFFFGTMGLFVFPWTTGNDLIVQVSHIIMTLNLIWSLWIVLRAGNYEALGKGLLVSVAVFIPFIAFTQAYCREHADEVMRILGM